MINQAIFVEMCLHPPPSDDYATKNVGLHPIHSIPKHINCG